MSGKEGGEMDMARPVPDEQRFLAFARDGDAQALEDLLTAHVDSAYTQARRLLGNGADADDAVQEAYLQLARGARRYDPAIPFRAWLGRLVHIAALRVRRADRRRMRLRRVAVSRMEEPAAMDDDIDHDLVRRAVADLPESYRAPIDLHYFAGLSQADVARALGVSENAVSVRIHRGRERLRKTFSGMQPRTAGTVVAALTSAPAHAAPATSAAHAATVAAWAANGSLPATTVKLSLIQHGASLMSQYPLASGAIATALAAAALIAPLAHAADDAHRAVAPPQAAAASATVADAAAATVAAAGASPGCWTGRAAQLLPYVDSTAMIRMGVDADALRATAETAPPTAMLVDPRLSTTIAHVRRMLETWSSAGNGVPPILRLCDDTHGVVLSLRIDDGAARPIESGLLLADLGGAAAPLRSYIETVEVKQRNQLATTPGNAGLRPYQPITIGSFVGYGAEQVEAFDGERFVRASPENLRRAIAQPTQPSPSLLENPRSASSMMGRFIGCLLQVGVRGCWTHRS